MVWNKGANKYAGDTTTCEWCGKVSPHPRVLTSGAVDYTRRRFCSNSCAKFGSHRNNERPKVAPTFVCEQCGETAPVPYNKSNQSYRYSQRFCSKECANLAQVKVGGVVDKNGYRVIWADGKRYQFEHRVVMERHIGRLLKSHETVHHKDGNRLNNSLDNLELWSSRHGKGQRVTDKIAFCIDFLREYGISVVMPPDYNLK